METSRVPNPALKRELNYNIYRKIFYISKHEGVFTLAGKKSGKNRKRILGDLFSTWKPFWELESERSILYEDEPKSGERGRGKKERRKLLATRPESNIEIEDCRSRRAKNRSNGTLCARDRRGRVPAVALTFGAARRSKDEKPRGLRAPRSSGVEHAA